MNDSIGIRTGNGIAESPAEATCTELEAVSKSYAGRLVLQEVSMNIRPGTITALIGRNGSGKSTLLSILAGLVQVTSGVIHRKTDLLIGYAPEAFPGLKFTPEQYLRSMGKIRGLSAGEIEVRMAELLELFQLVPFQGQPMINFSKGMLQKINLIQSLLVEPELLLLDEPMSGLDLSAQNTLVQLLRERKKKGTAVIFSVHEPQWVEALADQLHILQAGRTVRTWQGMDELSARPSTYIVFKHLQEEELLDWREQPGFLSMQAVTELPDQPCLGLCVDAAVSDNFLRLVLERGGSIVSVELRDGWADLVQWMNPKTPEGGERS
ncbi:ATP-binding cassette domain-containing protein [Paenibacillus sp. GCM10012306]|uniref:ATP-binding cassette domain-containing protein n=1 Tax=Paenibacillus sp. GCM10012306 TaxID=3317342 RepID=UPI003617AEA0